MKFYNKANTLKKIRCKNAVIPKFLIINTKDYLINRKYILKKVVKNFDKNKILIIRSSSSEEDTNVKSNAGRFVSVPSVKNNENTIEIAIDKVINSYKKNKKNSIFFIQEMISDCDLSGVITT